MPAKKKDTNAEKPCEVCGKPMFQRTDSKLFSDAQFQNKRTCSYECRDVLIGNMKREAGEVRVCANPSCNKEFHVKKKSIPKQCCSRHCAVVIGHISQEGQFNHRMGQSKDCLTCGNKFYRKRYEKDERWATKKYCGKSCTMKGALADPKRMDKIKKTNLKKYGATTVIGSSYGKDKRSKTLIERYGTDNINSLPEIRTKYRIKAIERIENNYGICYPNYSRTACDIFYEIDQELGFNIGVDTRYAVYGGGEYKVKELGYFVDYINFSKKVIIEWDDMTHFMVSPKGNKVRTARDLQRKKEIMETLPDFNFVQLEETTDLESVKTLIRELLK